MRDFQIVPLLLFCVFLARLLHESEIQMQTRRVERVNVSIVERLFFIYAMTIQ